MLEPRRWREFFLILFVAISLAIYVRSYLITAYKVPTGSMQPSLKPGDFIFSSRVAFGFLIPFFEKRFDVKMPLRGDLVVFNYLNQPSTIYVKRVVGLPGDKIQVSRGRIILNDEYFQYSKLADDQSDNPNSELFDVFEERLGEEKWKVIFQKKGEEKNFGPIIVPPGEVFLLGDNRDASDDSRYWGAVSTQQIHGRVAFVWMSLDWQQKWGGDRYPTVRWNRVFQAVR